MSKIIEGNKVIEGNAKSTIKVKDGTQLIESSGGTSKLEYWYPNHLYIYGTQTIRGNNESSQLVFYINKLEVK